MMTFEAILAFPGELRRYRSLGGLRRLQYWRDLGAEHEQRQEEQELEDPDIVFPTSSTLFCFKVKVRAIRPPLSLSEMFFFVILQCSSLS